MKRFFLISIIAVFLAACGDSSVDKALDQVDKALQKVEKNKGAMTESDWQNLNTELEAPLKVLSEAIESDKVGAVQKLKIVTVTAKWAAVIMEAGFNQIEIETGIDRENWGTELEKAAEELEKAAQELENASQDLENAADEAGE